MEDEIKIRWTGEKQEELDRLENARNRARKAERYANGDFERIQELREQKRLALNRNTRNGL